MKILRSALCTPAAVAFCLATMSGALQAQTVIVDDSFADLSRTSTEPLDANWWSSSQTSGSNVQVDANGMTLVTGTSGRGLHATFAPQTLEIGQSITATYSFTTPATVGEQSTALRIALMDLDDPALAGDQSSSSSTPNPLYVGQPGYFTAFDVSTLGGGTQDTDFRKHDVLATSGRFLGTTGEWTNLSSSADAGYAFAPNTDYVGVYRVTRTGPDSVELFSSMSLDGGALLDSHTTTDSADIANNYGMLAFWVNSNTFGSSNVADTPDNGITFTNVLIESTADAVSTPPGVVVHDEFGDGNRASTGLLDADWWSSSQTSGSNVQDDIGSLTLVTGTSGRGMHATFAPQTLEIGDTITATYEFTTPATIGATSTSFRIALMDLNDPGLAADQFSSSSTPNPLYVGQPGYFTSFDVDPLGGGSQDTDFRKHDVLATAGRFLGTTSEWISLSSSSDAGYSFAPNTDYVGVYSITRTAADEVILNSSLSLAGGAALDSHTHTDSSDIANNFGMLAFWVNSNTFGSSNSADTPDNGLIFTHVKIESTVAAAEAPVNVPVLPFGALILLALSLIGMQHKMRKI